MAPGKKNPWKLSLDIADHPMMHVGKKKCYFVIILDFQTYFEGRLLERGSLEEID